MQIPKGSAWAGPGTIICRAQWIDASDPQKHCQSPERKTCENRSKVGTIQLEGGEQAQSGKCL